MGWFRDRRRQKLFTRAWRDATEQQFAEGKIIQRKYLKCMNAADNPKVMRQLMKQTETEPGLYGGISDWNWDAVIAWIKDYFIPLMKILLPLLLILDEKKTKK